MEGETLYSIKWYQGLSEIYRYTPSKRGPVQVFPNDFLIVDVEQSSAGRVHVSNVSVGADGPFRCEVSAEAPTFFTDYGVVQLRVIALPEGGPVILGVFPRLSLGDWVALTCITRQARPAPTLEFWVNGERPKGGWVEPQSTVSLPGGLYSTSLRMRFYLREDLLQGPYRDEARVRCNARIPELYEGATEELLTTQPHRPRAAVQEGRTAGVGQRGKPSMGVVMATVLGALLVVHSHSLKDR